MSTKISKRDPRPNDTKDYKKDKKSKKETEDISLSSNDSKELIVSEKDEEDITKRITNVLEWLCNSDESMTDLSALINLATHLLSTIPFENIQEEIGKLKKNGTLSKKYMEYKSELEKKITPSISSNPPKEKYLSCLERLSSFEGSTIDNDVLKLAEAGFYLTHKNKNMTTCFFCKIELDDWKRDDIPMEEHYKTNPLCHFIQSIYIPDDLKQKSPNDNIKMKIKSINKHLSNFFRELADTIDTECDRQYPYKDFDENMDIGEEFDYPQYPQQFFNSKFMNVRPNPIFGPEKFGPYGSFGESSLFSPSSKKSCGGACKKSRMTGKKLSQN